MLRSHSWARSTMHSKKQNLLNSRVDTVFRGRSRLVTANTQVHTDTFVTVQNEVRSRK